MFRAKGWGLRVKGLGMRPKWLLILWLDYGVAYLTKASNGICLASVFIIWGLGLAHLQKFKA